MEKKQSSIEWFANKVKNYCDKTGESPDYHRIGEWLKEAKVIHKKEHEDAYIEGSKCKSDGWAWNLEGMKEMADTHYNEIYGK